MGHIELPVPVYHVTFMPQMLRLLQAKCDYCGHFRLHEAELSRYICKLKLLQHGLLQESNELENIQLTFKPLKGSKSGDALTNGVTSGDEDSSEESASEAEREEKNLIDRRKAFVKQAIRRHSGIRSSDDAAVPVEAICNERRSIVKQCLADLPKRKVCGHCKGVSRKYRRDKFNKIFRKPLGVKDQAKMAQTGKKAMNPLVKALQEKKAYQQQRREEREIDEAIDVHSDEISSEGEGEDIEMLGVEAAEANTESGPQTGRKAMKSSRASVGLDEYVNPQEVHASLDELFRVEREILQLIYDARTDGNNESVSPEMFFVRTLLVPPNKYRPSMRTGNDAVTESQDNTLYKQILNACQAMNQIRHDVSALNADSDDRPRLFRNLQTFWIRLQDSVNSLFDQDRNPVRAVAQRQNLEGVKQKLEKKEGLFRQNMMGKRVNFAARSVISPDVNIETNEIGVPPVFAKKLTYPEPVTNHNYYELKNAVINGYSKWPGASAVENENGLVVNLRHKNLEDRTALANQLLAPSNTSVNGARNKKVHRHLNNGDIVIMNRQPTLHKPSMMAHRARVLPGEKTIRMHYANCNTYNADFDGDEMNMHFPQNEIARAESVQIADTDHQYLSATSGKPLRGLIQDHISMGVWLTNRDTFFDRNDYQQLLCSCLKPENGDTVSERILTVAPAVIKPSKRWTGKQVITTILKNVVSASHAGLTLEGRSQTQDTQWGQKSEEQAVIFQQGELLCGILDKAQLGPSGGGFIHAVYESYGHIVAGKMLSILGRLLTKLMHMRAFTCGMDDLGLSKEGDQTRLEKLREADTAGLEVAAKYVTIDGKPKEEDPLLQTRLREVLRDHDKHSGLDSVYKVRTSSLASETTKACLPAGLRKPFPKNQMQLMTGSGAKGSMVNANQISCNLGQQVLEGRRVPVMVSGKTLPTFRPFDTHVRAGGYIGDRFLTGVTPAAYFFHAMAGREGLIDTAVKTASSGYLQRCLIKVMEDLGAGYDGSVRGSDGTLVQFLYGEDGLDVTKQKHLMDFKFLAENYLSIFAQLNVREEYAQLLEKGDDAAQWHKKAMKQVKAGRAKPLDPVLAIYNPGSTLNSTSETFASALKRYVEENPHGLIQGKKEKTSNNPLTKKTLMTLLDIKYMKSVVDPGEAVGIVAGQSVGEPSTQMTLNTFHLAGHSAKNVTLGIPRLREIVMTASKQISTPTMTLEILEELSKEDGAKFAKGITALSIAEILEKLTVHDSTGPGKGYANARVFDIQLDFFPATDYMEEYNIQITDVMACLEHRFVPLLVKEIKKAFKKKGSTAALKKGAQPEIGKSAGTIEQARPRPDAEREGGASDEEGDQDNDDDATNNKQRHNRDEAVSYAVDEEEEAIAKRAQRETTPEEPEDEGYDGRSPGPNDSDSDSDNDSSDNGADPTIIKKSSIRGLTTRIIERNEPVSAVSFDPSGAWCTLQLEYDASVAKLLLLPLVESALRKSVIQAIPSIGAVTHSVEESPEDPHTKQRTEKQVVHTQGVNLPAMHLYQGVVHPHKIRTNDIHAMMQVYGVEAGRQVIILELDAVFKSHSISVDNRHLNLIADVMTQAGGYKPFNRIGMRGDTSPFKKMSFETTVGFLRDAVLERDTDYLIGPSGRIVVGRTGKVGTGGFDVIMPIPQGS